MGPMIRGEKLDRRKVTKWSAAVVAVLMLWSLFDAPSSPAQEEDVTEPADLAAYYTFADAAPVQTYFDHQVYQIPFGPALAHSQTEVALPSSASGVAWLVDGGLLNGAHGTTTGANVPTEASAKQPGGSSQEEYSYAGGPVGADEFMRVRAGRALAFAERSDTPLGYANAYYGDFWVLPAAGSPGDPPGTYDPDATFPGGDGGAPQPDPAPRGQMAILSIGSIASSSQSFRQDNVVTSVGVAELNDINIGNRTSDNRCTNCFRIDSIRAEAFAQANGKRGGAQAAYRVILGRACRRAFVADPAQGGPKESDECLPLDPHDPESTKGLQSFNDLEQLNEQFEKPIFTQVPGLEGTTIGIRIHAGSPHSSPARKQKTISPPDDPRRNYVTVDKAGEFAKAVAEGLDVEIWTITTSQFIPSDEQIAKSPAAPLVSAIDQDKDAPGIQVPTPDGGNQTIPLDKVRAIRRVQLTLGVATASAIARPLPVVAQVGGGGEGPLGSVSAPTEVAGTSFSLPPSTSSGVPPTIIQGGVGGKLKLKVDWSSIRLKPWKAGDMAQGLLGIGIGLGALWLIRRRLKFFATH